MVATKLPDRHLLAVGTFNTPELFTVSYTSRSGSLELLKASQAVGNHSWLSLDESKQNLYATCWTEPPTVAAYRIVREQQEQEHGAGFELLGTARTRARSGYVKEYATASGDRYLVSISGPSGEIWKLDGKTGGFLPPSSSSEASPKDNGFTHIQDLDFVTGECKMRDTKSDSFVPSGLASNKASSYGDFGGLRHGAHGVEFSPDGEIAYVPDIGRNCIWVFAVRQEDGCFELLQKCMAPRPNDGPRHTWSHPNGRMIYSVEEHTSMVDVFELVGEKGSRKLEWRQAGKMLPDDKDAQDFWADEVRLSPAASADGSYPEYLIASTRGLKPETKGYVSIYKLDSNGLIDSPGGASNQDFSGCKPLDVLQTPTSGGLANAVEPAPALLRSKEGSDEECHFALTDSETGLLVVLKIAGKVSQAKIREVARLQFEKVDGEKVRQLATAVWL